MKKVLFFVTTSLYLGSVGGSARGMLVALSIFLLSVPRLMAQRTVVDSLGEAYFFYINDYPHNSPFWGDDDALTDGIAHDDKYWYISVLATDTYGKPNGDWAIHKLPVSRDLMADYSDKLDKTVRKGDVPDLVQYGHAGDLDCFKRGTKYYLAVPMTGDDVYRLETRDSVDMFNIHHPISKKVLVSKSHPIIAFFEASTLHFINYAILSDQEDVGWCAANATTVFSSNDSTKVIRQYRIAWDTILNKRTNHHGIQLSGQHPIVDKNNKQVWVHNMQGGEFTPTGNMLYISCGLIECVVSVLGGGGGPQQYEDGINVLYFNKEIGAWQIVQQSTNQSIETYLAPGSKKRAAIKGPFDYTFDNTGCSGEEPEGLTIWDMDNVPGHDPHVTGQLHVLSYNHNTSVFHENEVFLKHYKKFNFPNSITVFGTTAANGEPKTNPAIAKLLNLGTSFHGADILYNHPPALFPPGSTPVTITVTDEKTIKVSKTIYVTVINRHDECNTALSLQESDRVIADNYCATPSTGLPGIDGYAGVIKDVWFRVIPSGSSLAVETFQVENGLNNTVVQAFSGYCDDLHAIAGDDDNGKGDQARLVLTHLNPGTPVFIRVTDYAADEYAKFGISVQKMGINSTIVPPQTAPPFTVFPNPTNGIVEIIPEKLGNYEASLYDVNNRVLMPLIRFTRYQQLDLTSFVSGVYFLDIYNAATQQRVVQRIVKR